LFSLFYLSKKGVQKGLLLQNPNHILKERKTKSEGNKTKTLKKIKSRNKERKTKIKPQKTRKEPLELGRQMTRSTHLEAPPFCSLLFNQVYTYFVSRLGLFLVG